MTAPALSFYPGNCLPVMFVDILMIFITLIISISTLSFLSPQHTTPKSLAFSQGFGNMLPKFALVSHFEQRKVQHTCITVTSVQELEAGALVFRLS